jgi:transcriptional regulator with XRE-family HTH domain
MKIAERITEKRIKAELSRNEVARRAELTEAYIGLLERGLRNPTVDVIERICGALGITIQEFFAVDQEIAAPPPDIYAFVNKRENHGVVRFISEMAAAGYNKEGIIKVLQSIRDIVE